jgi:ribosomal protein S18 acetylase RimI-like enzyme
MFKAFWPDVKGSYFFRSRRLYLDFMHTNGGRIYYIPGISHPHPPFALVGNWRSRADITALWYVRGEGELKRKLVLAAAGSSFDEGSGRFVTKPLKEGEARQFEEWGFEQTYRIVLLEKEQRWEHASTYAKEEVDIIRYKKKYLHDVLDLDATAFDDFWRLDANALETIATSCYRNAFLLARKGGEILGYAAGGANGRLGYLQRLGVHTEHQEEGVGEILVRHILNALRGMGAVTVMVNTQGDNQAALGLYRKLGFEETQAPRYIMQCTPHSLERNR